MPLKQWQPELMYLDISVKRIISQLVNFYKCSLSIHATNMFSPNYVTALIIFP